MRPQSFALTYPQLMNQALSGGVSEEDLIRLRRAYELAEELFDGFYRGQGMPFICHLVRTASILLAEKQPIDVVSAGLLHSAYLIGQFEDGVCGRRTVRHREQLVERVGIKVEGLIADYQALPWKSRFTFEELFRKQDTYEVPKRHLLAMRLANELEDYLDLSMAYRGLFPFRERIKDCGPLVIELARRLGLSLIADGLEEAYAAHMNFELPQTVTKGRMNWYEQPERIWQKMNYSEKARVLFRKSVRKWLAGSSNERHGIEKIDFDSNQMFCELDHLAKDKKLIRIVNTCIEAHRAQESEMLKDRFKPDAQALEKVSLKALEEILGSGKNIHGILQNPEISNCIVVNGSAVRDSFFSKELEQLRGKVDEIVSDRLKKLFCESRRILISNSGHFLYPPGGFMSWHTNSQAPGWRFYINYCEEPGKSFFRYRNPETGEMVTSYDKEWNFRLFKIDPVKPFWHAVYSETNRYSFGFRMTLKTRPRFFTRAVNRIKGITTQIL